jgi:hypothetical protein
VQLHVEGVKDIYVACSFNEVNCQRKYSIKLTRRLPFLINLNFLFADIPDIPEQIKFLKALQVADFSSNPISR